MASKEDLERQGQWMVVHSEKLRLVAEENFVTMGRGCVVVTFHPPSTSPTDLEAEAVFMKRQDVDEKTSPRDFTEQVLKYIDSYDPDKQAVVVLIKKGHLPTAASIMQFG